LATYLDFEQKIKNIQEDIVSAQVRHDEHAVEILEKSLQKEVTKTYKNLSPYQKLQLARHQDRPYSIDYINLIMRDKYEIHGDRHFGDDAAIVCFLGYIGDEKVMVIGEQKGRGTKNKLKRNFGMPHPEGYRKALAIGVSDRLAMMRYSVFSVISPEGCSAILWNDPTKAEAATNAMKITSDDLKKLDLIDDIIDEPMIGAHRDKDSSAKAMADYFLQELTVLREMSSQERMEARYTKLTEKGAFKE